MVLLIQIIYFFLQCFFFEFVHTNELYVFWCILIDVVSGLSSKFFKIFIHPEMYDTNGINFEIQINYF